MTQFTDGMLIAMIVFNVVIMGIPGLIALYYEWTQDRVEHEIREAKPAIWHLRPGHSH